MKFLMDSQLIAFAGNRLGYLTLPKAFQKIASLFVGFFTTRKLKRACSLR
jgi:hypothetical protein